MLNNKAGVAVARDDELKRLIVPAVKAVAQLALLCLVCERGGTVIIEIDCKRCGLDGLEVVSVRRADCQQLVPYLKRVSEY